jgi:hypothetical protein
MSLSAMCERRLPFFVVFFKEVSVNRKDASVKVRLTPAEQQRAQRLAEIAGCSVSEMIRRLVADARVIVRPSIVEVESSAQNQELILA